MALFLPKVSADKAWCWRGDPTFSPPPARAAYKSDAEHEAALQAYEDAWARHEETGDMEPLGPYLLPGNTPTVFIIGSLTTKQREYVTNKSVQITAGTAQTAVGTILSETIAYGCHDIKNLPYEDEATGETGILEVKRIQTDVGLRLPPLAMRIFDLYPALMAEIAVRIGRPLPKETRKSD